MSNSLGRPKLPFGHYSSLLSIAEAEVRRICFWGTIFLPLVYLPLIAINHHWINEIPNFLLILSLHLTVIWLGMGHGSSAS